MTIYATMREMSVEEVKASVRRSIEALNRGKAACLIDMDRTGATDVVVHTAYGMDIHGLEDFKKLMSQWYDGFPDIHFNIDDIVVEGDMAVLRYTVTGTHKGAFMGIPPTNKTLTGWAIDIYHIVGSKLVECWTRADTLGIMQQLGVIPTPKK